MQLKAAREGKLFSPTRIRRVLTVTRLLAPVVVPLVYRASIAARGFVDERRADRLGVPLSQLGQFSGHGAAAVGADRGRRAFAASGRGEEAQGRRDEAVRGGDHRPPQRSVGRCRRRREHAAGAAPFRPCRHRQTARRHRRRPDGPARPGLKRSSRCPASADRVRGVATGLLTAALAVAAHGAGGGALPNGAATVIACRSRGDRRRVGHHRPAARASPRRLLALLAVGQLLGHLLLSAAGHDHAGSTAPPAAAMLAAHLLAIVVGATLIAAGERLWRALSRAVRAVVRIVCPVAVRPMTVVAPSRPATALGTSACRFGVASGSAGQPRPLTDDPNDTRKHKQMRSTTGALSRALHRRRRHRCDGVPRTADRYRSASAHVRAESDNATPGQTAVVTFRVPGRI